MPQDGHSGGALPGGPPIFDQARAFAIHILTASGAGLALLALIAASARDWPLMFAWLGAALIVDGIDGPLARRFRVPQVLPRWSGEVLDLVIDFATYVFVPAYAIAVSGLLPGWLTAPLAVVIVTTSALYFADRRMKTEDNYFVGFPAIWNTVAFYMLLLEPPPAIAALSVAGLAAMTFLPVRFIHPVRVRRWRPFTILLIAVWAVLAIWSLVRNLDPGTGVEVALAAIGVYLIAAGVLHSKLDLKSR